MEQIKFIPINVFNDEKIISCYRFFNDIEIDTIPVELREQEADAITYIVFSSGKCVAFYANSESFTLNYEFIETQEIPMKSVIKVSDNLFWKTKINQTIISIEILYGLINRPYGVRLNLINKEIVELQYVSETDYTFDGLIIR